MEEENDNLSNQLARIRRRKPIIWIVVILLILPALGIFLIKSFEVSIAPEDAAKDATTVLLEGIAFYKFDKWFFLGSRTVLGVSSPGFHPDQLEIQRPLKKGVYQVSLRPLDGVLTVEVDAPDAWQLQLSNGEVFSQSPLKVTLPPGEIFISLSGKWIKSLEVSLVIKGRGLEQSIFLTAEPIVGTVKYELSPEDSTIRVDGSVISADDGFFKVPRGEHIIEFSHHGYYDKDVQVTVEETGTHDIGHIELFTKPVDFAVRSQPSMSSVFINGEYVGMTPYSSSAKANREYTVKVRKKGFVDKSFSVTPEPGESVSRFVDLSGKKLTGTFTAGVPSVISVNGKEVGASPVVVDVGLGDEISARSEGYVTMGTEVPSWADKSYQFHFDLIDANDYPYINAPLMLDLGNGMTMRKFPGGHVEGWLFGVVDTPRQVGSGVTVPPFYMATTEVTKGFYNKIVRKKTPIAAEAPMPVTGLSWKEAAKFTNAVSKASGLQPFYIFSRDRGTGSMKINPGSGGYRLPTESEWLYVARNTARSGDKQDVAYWGEKERIPRGQGNLAGRESKDQEDWRQYPHHVDDHVQLAPVKSYRPNVLKIYDMDGNAAEWLHNFSETQEEGKPFDIFGPKQGIRHLVKGGSYRTHTREELEIRTVRAELGSSDEIGFRLAKTLQ